MENYHRVKKVQELTIEVHQEQIVKCRKQIHKALMVEIAKVCEKHRCNFVSTMGTWFFDFPCGRHLGWDDFDCRSNTRKLINRLVGESLMIEIEDLFREDDYVGFYYVFEQFKQHIRSDDQHPDFPSYTRQQIERMF